jgi:hypothetical protein
MLDRAKILGLAKEHFVTVDYDLRNFQVHTGIAGSININLDTVRGIEFLALRAIAKCLLSAARTIGAEFHLHGVQMNVPGTLDALEEHVPGLALANAKLMALGERTRLQMDARTPRS